MRKIGVALVVLLIADMALCGYCAMHATEALRIVSSLLWSWFEVGVHC